MLTSAGNDQWSSFWSNCNPPSCNPPGSGTSSQLAGKPDTTGRTPLVALTATGALAVYPADHAHSYVMLALSTDGAGMPRVANALVPQPANEVQDVIGFGAAFADARHGYVALLVMQADGRSIITVVQTTGGGVSWLATTLPL